MDHHYLIVGANGQLGKQFARVLAERGVRVSAPEESACNITDFDAMAMTVELLAPTVVINCAAYNAVDDAERQPEVAQLVNATAVGNLARLCSQHHARFVHYSSDYVFDGSKNDLHTEADLPNPLNAYGRSKRAGELAALEAHPGALVLRTSWVFGDGTQNFIHKLRGWSEKNRILKLSADEVSVPTGTRDLADVTLAALDQGITGLYHCTNSGYASRYEWGKFVLQILGRDNVLIPVPMSAFPSPAQRPLFSAMSSGQIASVLGRPIPHWTEAVERFLRS